MERIRATVITSQALKTRKKFLGLDAHLPICPYSLCEAMDFDLRFVKISSFEGMYVPSSNLILISAERPEGRKRFTCAHEIGHHILGHGTIIDEILECGSNTQEESEADLFASMLLMPSSAVQRILRRYGVEAEKLTPSDAYIVSKYFGASYLAFITHIYKNLHLITYKKYQSLKKSKLPEIRFSLCQKNTKNQVFKVGQWWDEKAIEMEVGDLIVCDSNIEIDGQPIIVPISDVKKSIYVGNAPGITRIYSESWNCYVKVSRKKFQGFFQYKYEEDDE